MQVIFLLLSAIAFLTVAGQNDKDTNCGRYKRCCGPNAHCGYSDYSNKYNCECDYGYEGCPLVECHDPKKFQCVMKADPHLVGYELAKANLNWPCKYRLTRVQHDLEGGVPGLSFCSFEVFGYNEVQNGKYYTDAMEVSLSVIDSANQFFTQQDYIKFDFTPTGVVNSNNVFTTWGSGAHSTWHGVDINCEFDADKRFAIFSVPQCDFTIRFRPRDPSQKGFVPAISIVTGKDTRFGETALGRYPESLCGESDRHGDDDQLYEDRATFLGLDSPSLALLYDALGQTNVLQQASPIAYTSQVIQDADQCTASRDIFASCSQTKRPEAINFCAKLLTSLAKCAGEHALKAFNGCLEAKCGAKTSGCKTFNDVIDDSNNKCKKAPKVIRQFCNSV